jgi:hypothetical protein
MRTGNLKLFQIFYNALTRQQLDAGFSPLDNSVGARPDWCEYWAIRQILLQPHFADHDYLGFFSPRFNEKTNCRAQQVIAHVGAGDAEVFSFSPFFDHSALHINPFEQGERFHRGLTDCMEQVLAYLGISFDVRDFVSDHTTTIFSNYFVARYDVWMIWFELAEKIFELCEQNASPLAQRLNAHTYHRGMVTTPMKVFVIERLITLVLETHHIAAKLCLNPLQTPLLFTGSERIVGGLAPCDALKGQFRRTGNMMFLESYLNLRAQLLAQISLAPVAAFHQR